MQVHLTRGKVATIDAADWPLVASRKWRAQSGRAGVWYAVSGQHRDGTWVSLHRLILGLPAGKVDHVNRDGLDCRRENLRAASSTQNGQNSAAHSNSRTGVKGVYPYRGRYGAQCRVGGRRIFLGYFDTVEQARAALSAYRAEAHGAFARD
jgi:hypothetical protein